MPPGRVRVAAVQVRIRPYEDPGAYADHVYRCLLPAVKGGAQLVAFPEEMTAGLVGLLPGMASRLEDIPVEEVLGRFGPDVRVADVFAFIDPAARTVYHTTFSTLARRAGVYLEAGSANLLGEDGRVYNEARLYGPDGSLLGRQRKLNLLEIERQWGLAAGDRLEVVGLPFARVMMPVCNDAGYWETFRMGALAGAELALVPQADPEAPFNPWNQLRGTWSRLQETPMYAVLSCMVGRFAGFELTGQSAVLAPLALSPGGDGVLARVDDPRSEGMALADLDFAALRNYRVQSGVLAGLRPRVYTRYLPALYRELAARGGKTADGGG